MYSVPNRLEVNTDLNIVPADRTERAVWDEISQHRGGVPTAGPRSLDKLIGVVCPIDPNLRLIGPSDGSDGGAEWSGVFECACHCSKLAMPSMPTVLGLGGRLDMDRPILTSGPTAIPTMLPKLRVWGLVVDANVSIPIDRGKTRTETSSRKSRPNSPTGWTPTVLVDSGIVGLLIVKADVGTTPDNSSELRGGICLDPALAQGA